MKKAILLAAIAVATTFSACNKFKYEPSPIAPGVNILNVTAFAQSLADEPVDVAFRLKIWLQSAKPVSGDIARALFGSMSLPGDITEQDGVYTVSYPLQYNCWNDQIKVGKIIINTNNNLLNTPEDVWDISVPSVDALYIETNGIRYGYTSCNYTITAISDKNWNIDGNVTVKPNNQDQQYKYELDWTVNYTLEVNSIETDIYKQFTKGQIILGEYGGGNGTLNNMTHQWNYRKDMVYNMSCSSRSIPFPISSGKIEARVARSDLDITQFPSNYATIEYTKGGTDCSVSAKIEYNGFSEIL